MIPATDLIPVVAGMPVNLPTNAHGQGYADLNFVIPELVSGIQFEKGTYFAQEGDFSAAGAIHMSYLDVLDRPLVAIDAGGYGYRRALLAASPAVGDGHLLAALELGTNDAPGPAGRVPQGERRPARQPRHGRERAQRRSHRYSVIAAWQRSDARAVSRAEAFVSAYGLDLFSNFTYFLDDPEHGDQFEQREERWITGLRASRLAVVGTAHPAELTLGIQLRYDGIAPLGLYHTEARERLATVRQDDVGQAGAALYAQADTQWAARVRTIVGLRGGPLPLPYRLQR
jgi:hypothetical protein